MPMEAALTQAHKTDAHLMLYLLTKRETGEFLTSAPRLNKSGAEWSEQARLLESKGLEVKVYWFVADFDAPGHKKLHELPDGGVTWLNSKKALLEKLAAENRYHFARYTTRGGARALAPLSHPLTPEEYELFAEDLIAELNREGLGADKITHWTALFRLPNVTRDGIKISGRTSLDGVQPIDTSAYVGRKGKPSRSVSAVDVALPPLKDLPVGTDPFSLVEWRGIESLRDKLKAGKSLGSDGNRYLETRAAIASVSQRMDEPRADVILKIFEGSLRSMAKEGSVATVSEMPSWAQKVAEGDRKAKMQLRADTDEILDMLAEKKVRDQTENVFAEVEKGAALAEGLSDVVNRLILVRRNEYYVWSEKAGEYTGPFVRNELRVVLRDLCPTLHMLSPDKTRILKDKEDTVLYGPSGGLREVDATVDLVGVSIMSVELVAGLTKSEFIQETATLRICAAPLRELTPEYSGDVDRWLHLVSGSMSEKFLDWLATFRKLTRPTCAVYLEGVPGAGKELLAAGIAQIFKSGIFARYEEMTSDFNDLILKTALVYADEKMPDQGMRRGAPSAVFRTLTSTDQHTINSKGRDKAVLKMCPRILITANDNKALNLVSESLEEDSVEAIAQRILHLCPEDRLVGARDYLREIGGRETTEAWVSGGAIARHILWLETTRTVKTGLRFLVEGAGPNVRKLIVGREQDRVLEALCRYLVKWEGAALMGISHRHTLIQPKNEGLFVNAAALAEKWSELMPSDKAPTTTEAGRLLANISGKRKSVYISGQYSNGYLVSASVLMEAADSLGVGSSESVRAILAGGGAGLVVVA
jgi:hypothetical protein